MLNFYKKMGIEVIIKYDIIPGSGPEPIPGKPGIFGNCLKLGYV
jgi:hypothetical protein